MSGVFVGHPFDTLKVRLQTAPRGTYKNLFDCFTKTVKKEGPRGLYKGLSSPLMGDSLTNAVIFGVYGASRRILLEDGETEADFDHLPLWKINLAGSMVGLAAGTILTPVELIKIRLQLQTKGKGERLYNGPFDCAKKVIKKEGVKGLFRGLGATWTRDIPSFGIYFVVYEGLRRMLLKEGRTLDQLAPWKQLIAGGAGGMAAWLVSYPQDVIKSRMQMDVEQKYRNMWHCMRESYNAGGMRVFLRGMEVTLLRAFPVNAVIFFVYQGLMALDW
ncbi:Solute carrier family 25 member 45 [Balamuthia mandrillaris]